MQERFQFGRPCPAPLDIAAARSDKPRSGE